MLKTETKQGITWIKNPHAREGVRPEFLSEAATEPVRRLHRSVEAYYPTPLVELSALAEQCGVKDIFLKDESKRFGLNAFKSLGGLYALFRVVCRHLGLDDRTATMERLREPDVRQKVSEMVFVTATDGNHGRGVAWAAGMLGCKAHVYMPKGSAPARARAIREVGDAEVVITDMTYDDAVRCAAQMAEEHGWFLVQDTSWPGYEEVPSWIVQGYTTMVYEALGQLREAGCPRPTHVFLQAGVGAFAGSILGALACAYPGELPCVSIVEPEQVACVFTSALRDDGEAYPAAGGGETIMAGLNCGEVCPLVWPILRDFADFYITCPDSVAAHGMRLLAAPLPGDPRVVSGESGAVTAGLASLAAARESLRPLRDALGLDEQSVVLLFSTEGDTDPEGYERVVRGGAYPAEFT